MQWAELEKLVAVGESETVEFKKSTAQPTSRPQNPYITNAFYRRGLIEQWGRGTNRIVELSVKAGNLKNGTCD
ncbi:MAG: ATP-binding protein [bacterium]